ncbi:MAG: phosphatase PAP2 family protein [Cytophagaceae bacterium]|nr:phosphatase PAP2 family protein [Cytophagaceae bacterium]
MLNSLINFDKDLFLYLNGVHSPFWDNFFWIFTGTAVWIPFYITVVTALFVRHKKQGIWTLLAIIAVIVLCDQVSSSIFKDAFERLRPSHEPALEDVVRLLNGKKGGLYGFISSHAANSFGLATFTALLFRKWYYSITVFAWAAINSYSRIYMGLHYPGDILGGLVAGILLGMLVYSLYKRFVYRRSVKKLDNATAFNGEVIIPAAGILFSVCMIALCSKAMTGIAVW